MRTRFDSQQYTTRFAPSPTGELHLGHAYSALFAKHAARGGRFVLRIEDIDSTRCRDEYIESIYEDLQWIGLEWELPVRKQSEHLQDYQRAIDLLMSRGLLYPCFCTRRQIQQEIASSFHAPHGPDGPLYPRTCRGLDAAESRDRMLSGEPYAFRLKMDRAYAMSGKLFWRNAELGSIEANPLQFGDLVLARKDIPCSYHLAVVVDDALQRIDLVTRGEDLAQATHVHRLLQALLDLPTPMYRFHRLLAGPDGKRLSKRDRSFTLRQMRQAGHAPPVFADDFS